MAGCYTYPEICDQCKNCPSLGRWCPGIVYWTMEGCQQAALGRKAGVTVDKKEIINRVKQKLGFNIAIGGLSPVGGDYVKVETVTVSAEPAEVTQYNGPLEPIYTAEEVLEAAGHFDLLEAATAVYSLLKRGADPVYTLEQLGEVLQKAGVEIER